MFKDFSMYNLRIILLSFMIFNCEDGVVVPNNPYDLNSENYSEVETFITDGPSEGSTITSNSATFSYTGGPLVVGYSHRMDFESNTSAWSDWTTNTVVTYENLDEGEHTFHVIGKYSETDIQSVSTTRSFIIDAVSGPSIRVFPQTTHADINSVFQIDVYAEELGTGSPVSGIALEIQYDSQQLALYGSDPIIKGAFLSDYSGTDLLIEELETGTITVNIGVTEGFNSTGLTGTGVLFSISFQTLSSGAQSSIEIFSAEYRDANNLTIDIQDIISGTVIIGQ